MSKVQCAFILHCLECQRHLACENKVFCCLRNGTIQMKVSDKCILTSSCDTALIKFINGYRHVVETSQVSGQYPAMDKHPIQGFRRGLLFAGRSNSGMD